MLQTGVVSRNWYLLLLYCDCKGMRLVVGGDGLIGEAVTQYWESLGHTVLSSTRRRDQVSANKPYLNLSDVDSLDNLPDVEVVVLAAGVAHVNDCEDDPVASRKINVDGVIRVSRRFMKNSAHLIYISSSQVFDGSIPSRDPNDEVCPKSEYGQQKVDVENELSKYLRTSILRVSKISPPPLKILSDWEANLVCGKEIHPFFDMFLAPVALTVVVERINEIASEHLYGIHHLSGDKLISYVDLAKNFAMSIGASLDLVKPISKSGQFGQERIHYPKFTE